MTNDTYLFDSPLECIYRAIRGLDRMADQGFDLTEKSALDDLQAKFTSHSRDELKHIYNTYGVVDNFEI